MNKWAELIIGLILLIGMIVIGIYSKDWVIAGKSLNFLSAAWIFLKGFVFWFIILLGILFILLAISDMRE